MSGYDDARPDPVTDPEAAVEVGRLDEDTTH